MSIVQLFIKNSQVKQFKYFKVLVQEFHVKVEMGFVTAMLGIVASKEYTEQEEVRKVNLKKWNDFLLSNFQRDYFDKDMQVADEQLYTHVSTHAQQEQKSFYDVLHFSPLKIHVSFSMGAGAGESTETSNFLNVILSSVGVTVTDMQDVIFKYVPTLLPIWFKLIKLLIYRKNFVYYHFIYTLTLTGFHLFFYGGCFLHFWAWQHWFLLGTCWCF